jgi:hypothetical protein
MKPISEWELSDLKALVETSAEEGSSLEFKASPALNNTQPNKRELVKDVCGFANAAGGVIVYGIVENDDGVAQDVDDGAPSSVTQEWIEQVLATNIEPQVAGLGVKRIPLANARSAFVINVPKATTFAPHQSKIEQRYYRRWGRITQRMYDHEIRDLMRRADTPELFLSWKIEPAGERYDLQIFIGNRSSAPALYGLTSIFLDKGLAPERVQYHSVSENELGHLGGKTPVEVHSRTFTVPSHLPIFAEQQWDWFQSKVSIAPNSLYRVGYRVACPGQSTELFGTITRLGEGVPILRFEGSWAVVLPDGA